MSKNRASKLVNGPPVGSLARNLPGLHLVDSLVERLVKENELGKEGAVALLTVARKAILASELRCRHQKIGTPLTNPDEFGPFLTINDLNDWLSEIGSPLRPLEIEVSWTNRPLEAFQKEIKEAGSLTKAAEIHNVSRQRYTKRYKDLTSKVSATPFRN